MQLGKRSQNEYHSNLFLFATSVPGLLLWKLLDLSVTQNIDKGNRRCKNYDEKPNMEGSEQSHDHTTWVI